MAGLFASTPAARRAAERCKDEGYLRTVETAARGKSTQEICALTDKGLAYLLTQMSPRQVLEDLAKALEGRQGQVQELVTAARTWQEGLVALQATVGRVLEAIERSGPAPGANGKPLASTDYVAVAFLGKWQASGQSGDCPLPRLFQEAQHSEAHLTIGAFHDGLRRLHAGGQIYLHPWTGPLYEIPEPAYALLVGHEIAYYASIR